MPFTDDVFFTMTPCGLYTYPDPDPRGVDGTAQTLELIGLVSHGKNLSPFALWYSLMVLAISMAERLGPLMATCALMLINLPPPYTLSS